MSLIRQGSAEARSAWTEESSARLQEGLAHLGVAANTDQLAQIQAYGQLLLKWNRTYNLLGATDAPTLVRDHLLDSLATIPALRRWLPANGPLLDIGSGAGLPGVVLAIMLHVPVMLVESNGKKAAFLRQVVAQCRLPGVTVAEARIEDLQEALPPSQPGSNAAPRVTASPHFICRAFTSLSRFASLCRPHLSQGSIIFAMKAARVGEELDELDDWTEVLAVEPLRTAGIDVQRNLVVIRSKVINHYQAFNPAGPVTGTAAGGLLGNHSHDR